MCCVCTGVIQTSPKHRAGCSNIWGASKHMRVSKHEGYPNILGCPHILGIQTYGDIQTYRGPSKHMGHPSVWGIWTPLSVTKHAFFVLCMYREHPNIIQTYRGFPHIWGHSNIQGTVQTYGASGCMGNMDTP